MMSSSPSINADDFPSISRPTAWETSGRPRQFTSPLASENGGVYGSDDLLDARCGSPSVSNWKRNDLISRRQLEAQEQLRVYKEELAKKNRLISELTSIENPRPRSFDTAQIDQLLSNGNVEALSAARSQVAALQIRIDGLQAQIRELNHQLELRDQQIGELLAQYEASKEASSRQAAALISLRQRVVDCDTNHSVLEGVASRSEHAVAALQRECQEAREHIVKLEAKLRKSKDKKNRFKEEKSSLELHHNSYFQKLRVLLGLSNFEATPVGDAIVNAVEQLVNERKSTGGETELIKSRLESEQRQNVANRETISRLSSERDQISDQLASCQSRHADDLSRLRKELDATNQRHQQLHQELERYRSDFDVVSRERDECKAKAEKLEHLSSTRDQVQQRDNKRYSHHVSQMLSVLAECDGLENPHEDNVVECTRHIVRSLRDKSARVHMLEQKLDQLTVELEACKRDLESRSSASKTIVDFEKRLINAENEIAAGDVLRDNLRAEREKFMTFVEQLCKTMGIDSVVADVGFDSLTETILVRAEQLIKNESAELVERKTHIFNLQRKLKIMKDQLDSKDVHMELLRKKVVSLEERLAGKTDVERTKDEESVRSRKLMKLAENYKRELNEAHAELRDLRARLLTVSDLQHKDEHNRREIERLEAEVERLENIRQQQSAALAGLKEAVGNAADVNQMKHDKAAKTIAALTSELRTTKQALEDVASRERQLVDLRTVIARMLGLAIDTLAVPDYEVITRLEQLILANQANAATAFALDSAVSGLSDGFHAGYRRPPSGAQAVPSAANRHHRKTDIVF